MSSTVSPRGAARESLLSRSAAMLVMLICAFYFLVPIWWLFVASTKDRSQFTTTNPLWFGDFTLFENIANLALGGLVIVPPRARAKAGRVKGRV